MSQAVGTGRVEGHAENEAQELGLAPDPGHTYRTGEEGDDEK